MRGISRKNHKLCNLLRIPYPHKYFGEKKRLFLQVSAKLLHGGGKLLFGSFHMTVRDGILQAQGKRIMCSKTFPDQGVGNARMIGRAVQQRSYAVI